MLPACRERWWWQAAQGALLWALGPTPPLARSGACKPRWGFTGRWPIGKISKVHARLSA